MNKKLCTSCGACSFLSDGAISMIRNNKTFLPSNPQRIPLDNNLLKVINLVCPAKGYSIVNNAKDLFGKCSKYDYRIGVYQDFFSAKSNNEKTLKRASSGGIMTELAIFLLKKGIVDGVIATKFDYTHTSIKPITIIATTPEELYECQGSKYMPIPALTILNEVKKFNGKLAYIGTPCQIAALRNILRIDANLNQKIKYLIGNFCGGFRDLREQAFLVKLSKVKDVTHFQYRGGGQPGFMEISSQKEAWKYPYPDYSKLSGYMKKYRCRVCIDATAELADISCGDAWIPELSSQNWSMVIVRNSKLIPIMEEMSKSIITKLDISLEQLLKSQKGNLTSKKERFLSRNSLLRYLGQPLPIYDGGWNPKPNYNVFFEVKVVSHEIIKYVLFKLNLLSLFRKHVR